MSNDKHKNLNRNFRDRRGIPVKVIEWEPHTSRVYFMWGKYEHRCFVPLWLFRRDYTEVK
ncbi:DUF4222 domain-containing protein [Providencia rettgeri]|uniref:DUF4222 domain-containing protein n=1 Tax=Providencia rettgeri TaxID=587 RepID=UPI003525A766